MRSTSEVPPQARCVFNGQTTKASNNSVPPPPAPPPLLRRPLPIFFIPVVLALCYCTPCRSLPQTDAEYLPKPGEIPDAVSLAMAFRRRQRLLLGYLLNQFEPEQRQSTGLADDTPAAPATGAASDGVVDPGPPHLSTSLVLWVGDAFAAQQPSIGLVGSMPPMPKGQSVVGDASPDDGADAVKPPIVSGYGSTAGSAVLTSPTSSLAVTVWVGDPSARSPVAASRRVAATAVVHRPEGRAIQPREFDHLWLATREWLVTGRSRGILAAAIQSHSLGQQASPKEALEEEAASLSIPEPSVASPVIPDDARELLGISTLPSNDMDDEATVISAELLASPLQAVTDEPTGSNVVVSATVAETTTVIATPPPDLSRESSVKTTPAATVARETSDVVAISEPTPFVSVPTFSVMTIFIMEDVKPLELGPLMLAMFLASFFLGAYIMVLSRYNRLRPSTHIGAVLRTVPGTVWQLVRAAVYWVWQHVRRMMRRESGEGGVEEGYDDSSDEEEEIDEEDEKNGEEQV